MSHHLDQNAMACIDACNDCAIAMICRLWADAIFCNSPSSPFPARSKTG